jgi:hypothetical protein
MKTPEEVLESYWSSIDTMVPAMHKNLIINAMYEYAEFAANERVKYLVHERNELQHYKSNIQAWLKRVPTEESVKEPEESPVLNSQNQSSKNEQK